MGNKQSVKITHQKAGHDGIQVKKDEANGHTMSGLDLTDAVTSEASVKQNTEPPPPVTVTLNVKPTPASVEANGTKAKAPTVSVKAVGNQVIATTVSTEQKTPAESSTPAKDSPKQVDTPSMFNKMFNKKTGPVSPTSEANTGAEAQIVPAVQTESQKSPTPASVEVSGTQAKADASVKFSGTNESTMSSTPAKDAPKQVDTPSMFNKMFKKKTEANLAADAQIVPAVQTESQKSQPTPASVEVSGTQAKAEASVEFSGTNESTESSTPAKDAPKQVDTPSMFNKMFKKKTEANLAADAQIVPAVQTESQKSPTPVSVEISGTQAKADASVKFSGTNESTTSSTPAKDAPKQVDTPSMFNKMFKKKTEANLAADAQIVPAVQTESQKSPTPVSVEVSGTQAKADASVKFSGTNESTTSSTPAKDAPKQVDTPSMFNKMFKKKTEANLAADAQIVPAVQTESQKSPTPVSVEISGTQAKADASVKFSGTNESTTSSTPAKDAPKQVDTPSMFNKMFKKKTEANLAADAQIVPAVQTESQKSPTPASVEISGTQAKADASVKFSGTNESTTSSTPVKDASKQVDTPSMFNKMFKKKTEANLAADAQIVPAVQTESQKSEPTDIKTSTQAEKVPQGEAPKTSTTEVTQDTNQPEQSSTEEKSVMNFFKKTFVTSTKTTKEATASPDVSKDQSKKETPPAPAANVQEAAKVPPPPPPAPPKMESKAEPAVKKDEAPLVEVAATVSKEQDTPSKTKTKDSPFGKLFRTKALLGKMVSKGARVSAKTSSASVVTEEAKPVETQVDASKTSTLEAGAKAEPPPAPKPEEKKAEKKPSPFANLLKPKVLLGQVSAKIHAAASSAAAGISLGAGGAATEPKKETPAATTAPAEAAPSTKAKEEPKPAAPAAPAAASPDNKSVGSTDNSSPSTSRKLEKRNSIQLFFKTLGQKRHSDAGVQTEPVAPEKAK